MAKKHATVIVLVSGSYESRHRAPTLALALEVAQRARGLGTCDIDWGRCRVLPSGNIAGGDGYYRRPGDTRETWRLPSIWWMALRTNPRGWRPARIARACYDETAHIRAARA